MDHDTQDGILSFPFDHIYACHSDNVEVGIPSDNLLHNIQNEQAQNEILQLSDKLSDAQKEICHLKDLILIHLDLIQQQSDELIQKDKQITLYLKEIEKLKAPASQPENTLNFHIQNLTPPPLIQLAPAQTRVYQEGPPQVQITNLRGLITTTDNKTFDIKQDVPETYTCFSTITNKDPLPFANVGTLIDARYLQCSEASFVDNQQSLCLQPVIQPVIQPVLQPLTIQTSLQSVVQPIVQATSVVQPRMQTVQPLVQTTDQVLSPM